MDRHRDGEARSRSEKQECPKHAGEGSEALWQARKEKEEDPSHICYEEDGMEKMKKTRREDTHGSQVRPRFENNGARKRNRKGKKKTRAFRSPK